MLRSILSSIVRWGLYHRTVCSGILQWAAGQVPSASRRYRWQDTNHHGVARRYLIESSSLHLHQECEGYQGSFIHQGWHYHVVSPVDKLPQAVEHQHALYIKNVFSLLNGDVKAGNTSRVNEFFVKMKKYQEVSSGNSLPTATQYKAERINNAFPLQPFSSWQTSHWASLPSSTPSIA